MFFRGTANHIKRFTINIYQIVAGWINKMFFQEATGNVRGYVIKISSILAVWVTGIALLISVGLYVIFCRIFGLAS